MKPAQTLTHVETATISNDDLTSLCSRWKRELLDTQKNKEKNCNRD